ncbi:DMT family transporter [Paenibacillus sp. JX-17]|uniref:DMT family transporter n=1 Tax=Paenibacillus lacisoli TaxID=3064525 RepID=A0ABT9CFK1_9BACL|nr:DMT family transporter [Paenibacillus sp. JX-17]MDO7908058.1 DMT family transporter [Paenibacillus sp. JX-17]
MKFSNLFVGGARSFASLQMIVSMIIFGSIGYIGGHTGLPALELVFVRCLSATLFLGVCWFAMGKHRHERWSTREILQALLCGVFLVMNWVFLFKAFEETSVTVAISVYHLAPVLVLLLGRVIFKEKLTFISVIAIAICFAGTLLISGMGTSSIGSLLSGGVVWAACAALFYALTTLAGKSITRLSPMATTLIQTALGVFMLLPMVRFDAFEVPDTGNWVVILITGVIHTGVVYLLFFGSIRSLSTAFVSVIVFLDPAVAILLDTALTGFRPEPLQIFGIILIFGGMAMASFRSKGSAIPLKAQESAGS